MNSHFSPRLALLALQAYERLISHVSLLYTKETGSLTSNLFANMDPKVYII
jgi:hypothetical protein